MTTQSEPHFHVCNFTDFHDLTIVTPEDGSFRFSFSKRFGPMMIGKSGREIAWRPAHRSQFWAALHWWCTQDHRVVSGQCVYDVPAATRMWTPDGRNWVVDTPDMRQKFTECVIAERERTMTENVWRLEP